MKRLQYFLAIFVLLATALAATPAPSVHAARIQPGATVSDPLFIDPTLTWNTFLGGRSDDHISGIVIDGNGNIYVTGNSYAAWQGTTAPQRAFSGGVDAFVAKLDASGNLVWNTFLGGSSTDYGNGIALDGSGDVYVSGLSGVTWQGATPPQRAHSGGGDAFVAKLDASGVLVWNTFLGGSGLDYGVDIALDGSGDIYVVGPSNATWQGTTAPQRAYSGGSDAFVAKLDVSGDLVWNTFLGGSGTDYGDGITLDGSGNIYISGYTDATWQGETPPQRAYSGGVWDVFAAQLDASGVLVWNTFLGGSGPDTSDSNLVVDGSGNVYVTGQSHAAWQGTTPPRRAYTGSDAFAAKLDPSGDLVWNTFLGGSGTDYGNGIALDGSGNIYISGYSNVTWQGTTPPQRAFSGSFDAFAAQLDVSGDLVWNTFLGGSGYDSGSAITVDVSGDVYVTGFSDATWQGATAPQRAYSGSFDAFVAQISLASGSADLANLVLSSGTLNPAFAATTTSYTAVVDYNVTSITVMPTTEDATTIEVNGTPVASGSASGGISLNVGDNTITIIVIAEDGTTTKTYMVTVTRPACASAITVTNNADSGPGSLRQAITDICSGGTILFDSSLSGQMITLETSLIIDKDLTIDASVLSSPITISGVTTHEGTGDNNVFIIEMNRKVVLKDLTITKSEVTGYVYNGGISIQNGATLTTTDCTISNFTGDRGITNWYGTLTMMNSSVLNNSSSSGGGIYNKGTAVLTNVIISNNSAVSTTGGGGIYNNGDMTITGSTISNNNSGTGDYSNSGGGIRNDGTLTLTDSTVTGNSSGGIYNDLGYYGTSLMIANSTISNNLGGGIENLGPATVTDSRIEGNSADYGGGIYNTSTLTITNSTFSNNHASSSGYGNGGGIENYAGTLSVQTSTFSGNTAAHGGGIYNDGDGVVTINNSAIYDNHAGYGGGLYNHGDMALNNTTVSNNTASVGTPPYYNDGHGGGIYSGSSGSNLTLNNTTVTNNSSNFIAGGIYNSGLDPIKIHNSISANNIASNYASDCAGNITSLGYNLIGDNLNCYFVAATGDLVGTGPDPINPRLGPLQDNGGPAFTHALMADSPAIDAGDDANCPAADQRGLTRPQGTHCDIGAYEFDPPLVISIVRADPNPTSAASVGFIVTFSEPVMDVDAGDFTSNVTGTLNGLTIGEISGGGNTRTVTVNIGSGTGTLRLDVPVDASIHDLQDNLIEGLPFTSGQFYTIGSLWFIRGVGATVFGMEADQQVPADYDGDGKADIAVFRPSNATWYIQGMSPVVYGQAGDIPVVADYNGDGKDDIAVFRPSNSTWYVHGQGSFVYGMVGDLPVVADYTGDGKAEIAVFRPSNATWYIRGLGPTVYGQSGDIPVVADYTGDGKAEIAVFRPSNSTWYIRGIGPAVYGQAGDIPVVADYNGDGKADIAVFRPSNSTWYIYGVGPSVYGTVGDVPVVADYTGDGKADIAVFRP